MYLPRMSFPFAAVLVAACGSLPGNDKTEDSAEPATATTSTVTSAGSVSSTGTAKAVIRDDYANVKAIVATSEKAPPNGQKVLIVVANDGFYFKEYNDPRVELESAGFEVVVAAATKPTAMPHAASGQLSGDGKTTVDLTLEEVNPADYAALVFAGGWGASNYYYAYEGKIDYQPYDRKAAYATLANGLINAFVAADKYVVGICNGVLVLAWARVDAVSPLKGKSVAAPDGGAPAQTYLGQQYGNEKLVMSTFAADNGATVSPPYSLGDATTAMDDIVVAGKIITAQNQYSAQAAGARLAELLGSP